MTETRLPTHRILDPLPRDFEMPPLSGPGDAAHRLADESWDALSEPTDLAAAPVAAWTPHHRAAATEAILADWQRFLDPDQYCSIEWPPTAVLVSAGSVTTGNVADASMSDPLVVVPAVWEWHVLVEVWDDLGGGTSALALRESVHVITTECDPRDVGYRAH